MTHGGPRPGSSRYKRDIVRISASILRPVYLELVRQEKLTGVYRCQIVGLIVTDHLIGAAVDVSLSEAQASSHVKEWLANLVPWFACGLYNESKITDPLDKEK